MLKVLGITALISPLLLQLTNSLIFRVLDDLLFFALFLGLLLIYQREIIANKYCLMFAGSMVILLFFSSVNGLYNGNSLLVILSKIRQYKYLFLYFILLFINSPKAQRQIHQLFKVIAYASVPVAIFQRILNS
ncbi:MAG TPA: hypothetical protein VHY08_03310, partial [Bacillota bacterium]|nr:hypothetical protein [Bacillota bacterium]